MKRTSLKSTIADVFGIFFAGILTILMGCQLVAMDSQRDIPDYENVIEVPKDVFNAQSWAVHLRENYKYISELEKKDYWQNPAETVDKVGGDCDDLAILTYEILSRIGYKPKLYALLLGGQTSGSHAVCLYRNKEGFVDVFSNLLLIRTKARWELEALKLVFPTWLDIARIQVSYYGDVRSVFDHLILVETRGR